MNIIFLDVDGVINSVNNLIREYNETHKPHSGYSYPFDANCLANLKKLVIETNSSLVISSTWRLSQKGRNKLLQELKKYDLDKLVIGYTPFLDSSRKDEIKDFLSNFESSFTTNFIILDDDSDMGDLLPFLVKTNRQVGLTEENVEQAIKKLAKSIIKENDDLER